MEECFNGVGGYREELSIQGHADALLAFAEAERTAELNAVAQIMFGDEALEFFDNLVGTFDVAGTADAYCNSHKLHSLRRMDNVMRDRRNSRSLLLLLTD